MPYNRELINELRVLLFRGAAQIFIATPENGGKFGGTLVCPYASFGLCNPGCEARDKPFKLVDGRGLHILVCPTGGKLWRLKYRFGGKEKLLSFGPYPATSLATARRKRDEAKELLARGVNPSSKRN